MDSLGRFGLKPTISSLYTHVRRAHPATWIWALVWACAKKKQGAPRAVLWRVPVYGGWLKETKGKGGPCVDTKLPDDSWATDLEALHFWVKTSSWVFH